MFEAFVQGFLNYTNPLSFGFLMLGICVGILIGIIPALGGTVAMTLLLPLVYGIDRIAALSMMVAIHAIAGTGDAITSILMGIPGSGAATVSLLDGFPMTRKGEPGRALGIMMCSDTMGALLGVGLAFIMIPIVRPFVMTFGYSELFLLILMGLSFLAVLSKESPVKGLMAGFVGILLSLVGLQNSTGVDRLAFGNEYLLFSGLKLVPVILGLMAGTEMLELAIFKETIAPGDRVKAGKELRRQFFAGMKDVFHHKWLWFRSCVLGYIMGLIPGIGSEVAVWVSYGQAKQTSRRPELFGTGFVEGIIAPQSTMNAKEGASLLTTLCLGLPSGLGMAILLGALLMQDVIPGPAMLRNDLGLTFTLIWGLALANVIGAVLCYFIVGYLNLTWLITLPPRILAPAILSIVFLGAYTTDDQIAALVVTAIFSVIGLVMKRGGYSRASLILGFILGKYFENYFWLAVQSWGLLFFLKPVSLGIIAVIIALYVYKPILFLMQRRHGGKSFIETGTSKEGVKPKEANSLLIPLMVAVAMAGVVIVAFGYPYLQAKLAVLAAGGLVFILALAQLAGEMRLRRQRTKEPEVEREEGKRSASILQYVFESAWMAGLGVIIYFLGFILAIPLYICAYMRSHRIQLAGINYNGGVYGRFLLWDILIGFRNGIVPGSRFYPLRPPVGLSRLSIWPSAGGAGSILTAGFVAGGAEGLSLNRLSWEEKEM